MDIQISSNFERFLFEMNDRQGGLTAEQLQRFRATGVLSVEGDQFDTWVAPVFRGHRCNDEQTIATMRRIYEETEMLIDPHTAVAISATEACSEPEIPTITLATAHPSKFPDAVLRATGIHPPLPEHLLDLYDREEHVTNLPNDLASIQAFVASCR